MYVPGYVHGCLPERSCTYLQLVTIDHEGRLPVYVQLADIIESRIKSGELPVGRTIPSEKTLMQDYGLAGVSDDHGVSEVTV